MASPVTSATCASSSKAVQKSLELSTFFPPFPNGLPNISCIIRGKECKDPRDEPDFGPRRGKRDGRGSADAAPGARDQRDPPVECRGRHRASSGVPGALGPPGAVCRRTALGDVPVQRRNARLKLDTSAKPRRYATSAIE